MANMLSNSFMVTVDKASAVIEISKLGNILTPVNTTPTKGQYRVTITGTVNCTAKLGNDYKTITVVDTTDNKGRIDISINIENKTIYTKTIRVATITGTQQINSAIAQMESKITQTAQGINTEVSKKLNSSDLSSRIQQSPNDIKIGFNKINNFITIDPNNGLQVNHKDGSYTRISPGGFSLYNASKNYRYKALIATGYFSIKGKGTSVITLPAQFDDVGEWDIDFFFTIETNWGAASSAVDKTCIYEMYANDIFQIGMTKDSNGHWTKKVDYSLIDVCVKAGGSMQVGDRGDMFGFVHWIAFA